MKKHISYLPTYLITIQSLLLDNSIKEFPKFNEAERVQIFHRVSKMNQKQFVDSLSVFIRADSRNPYNFPWIVRALNSPPYEDSLLKEFEELVRNTSYTRSEMVNGLDLRRVQSCRELYLQSNRICEPW